MNTPDLLKALELLKAPRIAVIGDLILDEYIEGEVRRISREAPVPIVEEKFRSFKPGGAANTLANLATLGAQARAIGVVGQDTSGPILIELLKNLGIAVEDIFVDPQVPTTTKTRISAHSRQSVTQQVLRLDRLPQSPLDQATLTRLGDCLEAAIAESDLVLVSDYGNGVIVPALIEQVRQVCAKQDKPWIVDSQEDLRLFHGATLLTPNKPEAENNLGALIQTPEELLVAGQKLLEITQTKAVLITCGDEGMSLFERNGQTHQVAALNKTEVFDVTGAGDTVVATLATALASGCTMPESMELANLAASIVIRRLGSSTTTPTEMKATLLQLSTKGNSPA
ncbi:D-glycero-beta-D-manno-heptose-7-phosphate kinase [bacterium (Candidatus Blackallbacteria) CG17_big_fil_post_rev_8_21_14_2_50_48_46]|uniref:D-glycero-beta-D-manno-heptose-7-phosphate kinase n=1 Tax=bacterium (Candidatus Blackallbacteria) CG17_big_fil_post_rev_8_21_14_2_50_48_46 TaxID=2014261 RepID=A0A2M7G9T6_9BACT|nr:MAG: D-glycero-beta-D-manno-heptose-7-phosphate kinase [bacterium (Candidatus Blackallbacteria) CG18_big_fil_WC_8_21_14_2_50_49_26]PIW18825.1 MAG: D-glycero-beta-D-manno-heptose-7-phosphate kinase [bacterium (Candidatus Blackallbacteria) CG17_big_fil_post_rev_8_21_14_2_50_48_46]PIW49280.1 MAG: D-glycero-beta-D-manno-heptose-7-phosphate kinase [bacterium (Candidatus Blackallbacteria) CG13_big_fil_rev_8_21_14_2_50_49_14]